MVKAAHDVVVIPFRPRIERGGKVVKSGELGGRVEFLGVANQGCLEYT